MCDICVLSSFKKNIYIIMYNFGLKTKQKNLPNVKSVYMCFYNLKTDWIKADKIICNMILMLSKTWLLSERLSTRFTKHYHMHVKIKRVAKDHYACEHQTGFTKLLKHHHSCEHQAIFTQPSQTYGQQMRFTKHHYTCEHKMKFTKHNQVRIPNVKNNGIAAGFVIVRLVFVCKAIGCSEWL